MISLSKASLVGVSVPVFVTMLLWNARHRYCSAFSIYDTTLRNGNPLFFRSLPKVPSFTAEVGIEGSVLTAHPATSTVDKREDYLQEPSQPELELCFEQSLTDLEHFSGTVAPAAKTLRISVVSLTPQESSVKVDPFQDAANTKARYGTPQKKGIVDTMPKRNASPFSVQVSVDSTPLPIDLTNMLRHDVNDIKRMEQVPQPRTDYSIGNIKARRVRQVRNDVDDEKNKRKSPFSEENVRRRQAMDQRRVATTQNHRVAAEELAPLCRGVFCGYRCTKEEYRRMRSAHVANDYSMFEKGHTYAA